VALSALSEAMPVHTDRSHESSNLISFPILGSSSPATGVPRHTQRG